MLDARSLSALLAESDSAISIYLPIDRTARDLRAPAARLRDLINEAEMALAERGFDDRERARLLGPAREFAESADFAEHRDPGLALFLADGGAITRLALPETPPESALVGRAFFVRPLLPLVERNRRFNVLALDSDDARLFAATPQAWDELPLDDLLPPSLDAQAGSLPAGDTVIKDARMALLAHDLHALAKAVQCRLADDPAPLVLAAQPQLAARFTQAAKLPQLLDPPLAVNPFALAERDLHFQALARVTPLLDAERDNALDSIRARLGAGEPTASNRIEEILTAARDGRIDAMALAEDASLWGSFDVPSGVVALRDAPEADAEELINLAAVLTLRQGGRVLTVPRDEIPGEAAAGASFRW